MTSLIVPPEGPAPEAPPEPVVAPSDAPETFPRAYVEQLRDENAKWRTQLRGYEQAFDGLDDTEKSAWLEYVQLTKAANGGDEDAIATLQEAGLWAVETTPAPTDAPLTRDDIARLAREEATRIVAQDRESFTQQQAIADVRTTAQGLGYAPESPDYVLLLKFANDMDSPDLAKADQMVKEWKQAEWDRFVAEKAGQAAGSPRLGSGNGVPPSPVRTPKTWAEARDSLHARLEASAGQ